MEEGRTITDNEFHDKDESFQGYTDEEENVIYQVINPQLKPDADWDNRIRPKIATLLFDLHCGIVQHGPYRSARIR